MTRAFCRQRRRRCRPSSFEPRAPKDSVRKVTLTFDDGPSAATGEVLDVLADYGIRTTFFVVGTQLMQPGGRALTERAAAEGHWIGNHTLTHSVEFGDSDDPHLPTREVGRNQDLIGSLTHPDKLFRPTASSGILDRRLFSRAAIDYLRENRYTCVLWNCVPHDREQPEGWVEHALGEVRKRPWSVVVVHDLPSGAMSDLPAFLDGIDALGAEIVQEFPDSCVPIRNGVSRTMLGHLTRL
jgi:peptidoglycan-N-acetylglucosamine deacetylase